MAKKLVINLVDKQAETDFYYDQGLGKVSNNINIRVTNDSLLIRQKTRHKNIKCSNSHHDKQDQVRHSKDEYWIHYHTVPDPLVFFQMNKTQYIEQKADANYDHEIESKLFSILH